MSLTPNESSRPDGAPPQPEKEDETSLADTSFGERLRPSPEVARIVLRGAPYEAEVNGERISCTETLTSLAQSTDYTAQVTRRIGERQPELRSLGELGFHGFDRLLKSHTPLSWEQAYSLGAFICCTANHVLARQLTPVIRGHDRGLTDPDTLRLHAISLLQSVSTREALIGFAPQELAGLAAAVLELDTVVRVASPSDEPVFTFGGMGGDRGVRLAGSDRKPFSISTLAALALSDFGPVHKHHSYPNTSRIAGQSAIEALGARSDFNTAEAMAETLAASGLLMSSCHSTRTIHTISHVLKGETINHALGPAAVPHAAEVPLNALIGVNHNVHPATFIEALVELDRRGVQRYGPSVAFCGIDRPLGELPLELLDAAAYNRTPSLREYIVLDEVAPPPHTTLAAFLTPAGTRTVFISPTDFMTGPELASFKPEEVYIHNTAEAILRANREALNALNLDKVNYLAMTVALGLFARDYAGRNDAFIAPPDGGMLRINPTLLRACFQEARSSLLNGGARAQLNGYIAETQEACGGASGASQTRNIA